MSNRNVVMVIVGCLAVVLAGCGSGGSSALSTAPAPTISPSGANASSAGSLGADSSAGSSGADSSAGSSGADSSSTANTATRSSGAPPSSAGTGSAEAEDYCRQRGGEVQTRAAYRGTNGDQAGWLALAGAATMCRFQADDEAKSRIYVDLTTLSSPKPTLAALAYLSKIPMPSITGGANPATGYCSKELGGSSTFGAVGASGGGWVANDDPDDVVVALCVFPDLSFIDEWGLAYHSEGTIRGTDLATAMEYQPDGQLPPVFLTGTAAPTS